jgi:hypothetical protein
MAARASAASWLLRALPAAAFALAACAHAPPAQRAAARDESAAEAGARDEQPARALVTGSRLPQPVGRFGVPLNFAVTIYYWRGDPTRGALPGFGRGLPYIDIEREAQTDVQVSAQAQHEVGP